MRTIRLSALLLAAFTSSAAAEGARPSGTGPDKLCEREMIAASQRHGVPLGMLYAVGLTETGRGDSLRPYALNVDGKAVYELTRKEAVKAFEAAVRAGAKFIDVGCMQINHRYHRQHFTSVEMMLEPSINVDYAARYLAQLKVREGNWTMAVARYHAGPDNDPAQKRYVCRVISNMVATGFGKWTAESEKLCGVRVVNGKAQQR
ncbi:MAG: lytic transglycosylase domain-containing protein [Hyphomicrobiales bacterium]|nr:MAG: lytic transglycosylase domain-containing protein [Hyphomicrobiales bacterium]